MKKKKSAAFNLVVSKDKNKRLKVNAKMFFASEISHQALGKPDSWGKSLNNS